MKSDDDNYNDGFKANNNNNNNNNRLTRKRVMRRKNAVRRIQIHDEFVRNNFNNRYMNNDDHFIMPSIGNNCVHVEFDHHSNDMVSTKSKFAITKLDDTNLLKQITFVTNPSGHRIYSTIKELFVWQNYLNQFCSNRFEFNERLINNNNTNSNINNPIINQISTNAPILFDDDHFKQHHLSNLMMIKTIPTTISVGISVVLDIIKDTYEQNPKICIRSLESLYNLLLGLKPESLRNEPPSMIERYFQLIETMINLSKSSINHSQNLSMDTIRLNDNYYEQIFELSLLSLITLSIATGDAKKILNCIKILLIDCNQMKFEIELPEILILMNKYAHSLLLGRHLIPEWSVYGFHRQSLCETFKLIHVSNNHQDQLLKKTSSSLTFDGQNLILYQNNHIFIIGSGYNQTIIGQESYSSYIDIFNESNTETNSNIINDNCWIGYINGDLYLLPMDDNLSMNSSNHLIQLDSLTLKFKNLITLYDDNNKLMKFQSSSKFNHSTTLSVTDGDFLILISMLQDDYFYIREFKPNKMTNFDLLQQQQQKSKKLNGFTLTSEFTSRLSSICNCYCGQSSHSNNFIIPHQNTQENEQNDLKLIETNNYFELNNIATIMTGKDFALLLTNQGKVYYTGNSLSLGIRHVYSYNKWSLLNMPKPVKIVQIAIGHEGNHSLLLADDGTIFFVGIAKRGEDGGDPIIRSSSMSYRYHNHNHNSGSNHHNHNIHNHKPNRIKKFLTKFDNPTFIACNNGTSAIITKSGDLYLFGKDTNHTNSKGLLLIRKNSSIFDPTMKSNNVNSNFHIKSIAMGKAHMLVLSTNGQVMTTGFSNKGQCGFIVNNQNRSHHSSKSSALNNEEKSITGHTFIFGKSRRCKKCFNCTENGIKCQSLNRQNPNQMNVDEYYCICDNYGNSGCMNCGICTNCSEIYSICTNVIVNNDDSDLQKTAKQMTASSSTTIAPTILPLSYSNPIIQIAAGLHHSVLLSSKNEVFTFGSNQYGQLGTGDQQNRFEPTRINLKNVCKGIIVQIAAGSNHTVLLSSIGEVITFGNNQYGQLGRRQYKKCTLNTFLWNTFPDRMNHIGPEYGRRVTQISASSDFTFIKYDEILLNSSMFAKTKLLAEKNNLILIPPNNYSSINDYDNDKDQQQQLHCNHLFCQQQLSTAKTTTDAICRNFNSNILIVSRLNGNCSKLKQPLIDNQSMIINFDDYSSIFLDKYYHNLWTYNSKTEKFLRFSLISLEISRKIETLTITERTKSNDNRRSMDMIPTSLIGLNNKMINDYYNNSSSMIKYSPSIVQSNLSMPLSNNCFLKKTIEQIMLEILSLFVSLTHSNMMSLLIDDEKFDPLMMINAAATNDNNVIKNSSCEEYNQVCRFEDYGGGWAYPSNSMEAIRFSTDCDIILAGIGLYGGRGEYNVQIRLYDLGFDSNEIENDGELLNETDVIHYECLPKQKYQIFFDEPILIHAHRWYVICAEINGSSSDCGSNGQSFVCTSDQIMFHFKSSKFSNNGTDVNSGQIPILFYKQIRSNSNNNNYANSQQQQQLSFKCMNNFQSLNTDDDGTPFIISKDFINNIDSSCLQLLIIILQYEWNVMKNFQSNIDNRRKSNDINFKIEETKIMIEKFDQIISEIRKNLYVICFILELLNVYIDVLMPNNDYCGINESTNPIDYQRKLSFLNYDYDEYKKIANLLYDVCHLLMEMIENPFNISENLIENLYCQLRNTNSNGSSNNNNNNISTNHQQLKLMNKNLNIINNMETFLKNECYRTFRLCSNAFFPSSMLKWSVLCYLLDSNCHHHQQSSSTSNDLFSNKQLYLLTAISKSLNNQSIRLSTIFPLYRGSLIDPYQTTINTNINLSSMDSIVMKIMNKLNQIYLNDKNSNSDNININDYIDNNNYNCKFVYEKMIELLLKPLRKLLIDYDLTINGNMDENNSKEENIAKNTNYQQFKNNFTSEIHTESSVSTSLSSSSTSADISYDNVNDEIDQRLSESFNQTIEPDSLEYEYEEETITFESFINIEYDTMKQKQLKIYSEKLLNSICDLLLKFIAEFHACQNGSINMEFYNFNNEKFNFLPKNEYQTPSRFCRSSTKSWNTGNGAAEAICFSVNKSNIYISGVRIYASNISQFKYQLQLLDQQIDNIDNNYDNNWKWKKISTISGIYYEGSNSNGDNNNRSINNEICEIRFQKPIAIKANMKYAIVFKNYSGQYSFSGDMGMAQVRGDDDTIFTFMDCSLSKNGTNLNRGQIPQILYYNVQSSAAATTTFTNLSLTIDSLTSSTIFNKNEANKSIIQMFEIAIENCIELLETLCKLIIKPKKNFDNQSTTSDSTSTSSTETTKKIDWKIIKILTEIFDSIYFRRFLPTFMIFIKSLKLNPNKLHYTSLLIYQLIESINRLNNHLYEQNGENYTKAMNDECDQQQHLIVESDHPYKSASVTTYAVHFSPNIKFMTIEFDRKSCTAQPEDYLEIYIPKKSLKQFNDLNDLAYDGYNDINNQYMTGPSSQLLIPIHQRLSGDNFNDIISKNDHNNQLWKLLARNMQKPNKDCSKCIFVPGNEMMFMMKTSTNYTQPSLIDNLNGNKDCFYGFKAEIIGYEQKSMKHCNFNDLIKLFECNVINLFGTFVDSLLNCTPIDIMNEHCDTDDSQTIKKLSDLKLAEQIFLENHDLLLKGFDLKVSSLAKIKTIKSFFDNIESNNCLNLNPFLNDFVQLTSNTSASKLASWLQNESIIITNNCQLFIINNNDNDYCSKCYQSLISDVNMNPINLAKKICRHCHYQLFIESSNKQSVTINHQHVESIKIGEKIPIKIITRNQHNEIVYDSNAMIEMKIEFISFNQSLNIDHDNLLRMITENPYRITVKDNKTRYHSITIMKVYENYSLEELRLACPFELLLDRFDNQKIKFAKNSIIIPLQSFNNGHYMECWLPIKIGTYRIEILIDGEKSDNSYLIQVINCIDSMQKQQKQSMANQFKFDQSKSKIRNNRMKHLIRKFNCSDSAGLRIRSLPSLQSEQIGIVSVNGLLTIIDQLENDDGIWVRLSNESIQAYSTALNICNNNNNNNNIGYNSQLLDHSNQQKEFDIINNINNNDNDNNNVNNNQQLINNNDIQQKSSSDQTILNIDEYKQLSSSFTTLRTEAWALQFNKHFNRTLLMAIDSDIINDNFDNDINDDLDQEINDEKLLIESLTLPGWFQVIRCEVNNDNDKGNMIRNVPSLIDGFHIGLIPLNEIVFATEVLQNEFGYWIRLSQESLCSFTYSSYRPSSCDGWSLIQNNNEIYMKNIRKHTSFYDNINIGQKEHDDLTSNEIHVKRAISNRMARCIRAIFAAFIWHQGILQDFLTAASYLRFNSDITKESLHQQLQQQQSNCIDYHNHNNSRKNARNRQHNNKIIFRHSVEISQLLMKNSYQQILSDVNSNVNFFENNNNNNNIIIDNNDNHQLPQRNDDNDSMKTIPEILMNILQIWELVSSECLNRISSIKNDFKTDTIIENKLKFNELKLSINKHNENYNEDDDDDENHNDYSAAKQQQFYGQNDLLIINDDNCNQLKIDNLMENNQKLRQHQNFKCQKLSTNNNNLYDVIEDNVKFLLSLQSSNGANNEANGKNSVIEIMNKNLFENFIVDNTKSIYPINPILLNDFGIKKSIYKQKFIEECLLIKDGSNNNDDYYQYLLSPDIIMKENFFNEISEKKPIKFHRSISIGVNDVRQQQQLQKKHRSNDPNRRNDFNFSMRLKSINNDLSIENIYEDSIKKQNDDNNNNSDNGRKMINVPFLCRPSTKLMNLIQKHYNYDNKLNSIKNDDILKFIFTNNNINTYDLIVKYSICSSLYRSLALNVINSILVKTTNPNVIHDLLWIFINSSLPDNNDPYNDRLFSGDNNDCQSMLDKNDICRHPFDDLKMSGQFAEHLVTDSFHRLLRTISSLLPLLPFGSPLQRMAIRCFAIRFTPNDHNFLHECKVFSHISSILTRSSDDSLENSTILKNLFNTDKNNIISMTKDITQMFDLRTSSRSSMISSLLDNSTETFWESGNEDRNKIKYIQIQRKNHAKSNDFIIRFICIYLDNTRDSEYRVTHIEWKICRDTNAINSSLSSSMNQKYANQNETIKTVEIDQKFCGWLQCELSVKQSNELFNDDNDSNSNHYFMIEINGPFPCVRVRQIKLLANESSDSIINYSIHSKRVKNIICEMETLRVFRLLTSQVFGKLLSSSNEQCSFNNINLKNNNESNNEKRRSSSLIQWSNDNNNDSIEDNNYNNNNNDKYLREHMVGILFSQCGKLTELQRQVCTHIVNELHLETNRVLNEWNDNINNNDSNNYNSFNSEEDVMITNDIYCFELLSLLLALSGSIIGKQYLSKQLNLLNDILILSHTSSDRVKRQILLILRRMLTNIKPDVFTNVIFEQLNDSENNNSIMDIFIACIAKSLTVQIKMKGNRSKMQQSIHRMSSSISFSDKNYLTNYNDNVIYPFNDQKVNNKRYWMKGNQSKHIGQSIIALIKDISNEKFGSEWANVARNSLIDNINKLNDINENIRHTDQCLQIPELWMAMASLCVIDEKDVDTFAKYNIEKQLDSAKNTCLLQHYCDNHNDGETIAFIQCNVCGQLCVDCDRFLHLNSTKTCSHKRHMFKSDSDKLKIDIHEGCGRIKFYRTLIVADIKVLKILIEFRSEDFNNNDNDIGQKYCRFCGIEDPFIDKELNVCQNEDCQRYALQACNRILNCGHYCCGIRNESPCLPCLNGCSNDLKQDGDDMCMICFSDSLFSLPCIQLVCSHIFHYECVRNVLEKRWSNGGRITFTFSLCPICKIPIDHQSLNELLKPIQILYEDVRQKSLMRLEFEGLKNCEALTTPNARFYQDPVGFAMERYSYYLCFKCDKAYYGGEARCDIEYDDNNYNPQELICGSCSDIAKAQICPKHGQDFLEYKCRFCCSVAVYFCFGSTHFCNACHDDFQRLISLKEYPQCPVGPHSIPLDDCNECPLHIEHPPTGQEFALGCGICRNTHTF